MWRIDSHGGEDWKPGDHIGSYCNSETCFEGIDDKSLLMNWILPAFWPEHVGKC